MCLSKYVLTQITTQRSNQMLKVSSRQTINDILAGNMAHFGVPRSDVWLADDDYENLPDFNGAAFIEGTRPTVEASWRSPFIGKSLAEAVAWVRGVPKPPKPVCKKFFAVLQKDLYESKGEVLICKVKRNKSGPQTIHYDANHIAAFRAAYYRDNWQEDWEMQFRD